jgi:FixJ family two-component response regulator
MPSPTPTVFVVDPDASARASLETAIRATGWTVESFASARAFLARRAPRQPSCLVMALPLAELSGLDALRLVVDRAETPVVALCGPRDIPSAVLAMKAGVAEVLATPPADEALREAIEHAISLSDVVLEREAGRAALRERHASLTARERQIMAGVVAGHPNKRIAATLGISEITVKAHRGRVMRKMGAASLPDLVTMALTLRFPAPSDAVAPLVEFRSPSRYESSHSVRTATHRGWAELPPTSFAPVGAVGSRIPASP